MVTAATTSPFMSQQTDAAPWLLWTSKDPVTLLNAEKQTDGRSAFDGDLKDDPPDMTISTPFIPQTRRYNAVLSRMEQASKKAAAFSAWNN